MSILDTVSRYYAHFYETLLTRIAEITLYSLFIAEPLTITLTRNTPFKNRLRII